MGGQGPATAGWRHFEHGADIGIEGYGRTAAEAFEQAALALTAVICDPRRVRARSCVDLACEAPDLEYLLVDWLNALIYEMATRRMLFSRFEVTIGKRGLRARACGEPLDPARHRPAVEVKGATLTGLAVRQEAEGHWVARCVVDV